MEAKSFNVGQMSTTSTVCFTAWLFVVGISFVLIVGWASQLTAQETSRSPAARLNLPQRPGLLKQPVLPGQPLGLPSSQLPGLATQPNLNADVDSMESQVLSMVELPVPAETGPAKIWMRDSQGEWTPTVLIRKVVRIDGPISGSLQIFTSSAYDVFCNGRQVGSGDGSEQGVYLDVTQQLRRGDNVLAIQARRTNHEPPGLGLRFRYHTALTRQTVETDSTWLVAQKALPVWRSPIYNDRTWQEAVVVRPEPRTAPSLPVPFALAGFSELPKSSDPLTAPSEGPPAAAVGPGVASAAAPSPGVPKTQDLVPIRSAAAIRSERQSEVPTQPIGSADLASGDALIPTQVQLGVGETASSTVSPIYYAEPSADRDAAPPVAAQDQPPNPVGGDEIELRVPENFTVEAVAPAKIGSLIKIEFDEFGRLLASREDGGLLRIDLSLPLEHPGRVTEICDQVTAIQGILPLNGSVYVTGVGPEGLGVYLLEDKNNDSQLESVRKICGIVGKPGEHGPHAIQLGTDRMLYILIGNHTQLEGPLAPTSPLKHFYEGDLLPRYEDPSGHAHGVKSPGGTLVRISLDGKEREIVAGGIRNAYSFAFNQQGDIILHDSDMESDEGTSWYRPTQIYHVFGGADFGWRSGWAKWPQHYPDAVPPIARTGRGSPSGAVVYDHVLFPSAYHNAFFSADWAAGRILVAHLIPDGATYRTSIETFMEGRPLNVTDLAVGPQDGALYIALGGRQSSGGIYRVRWMGEAPPGLTSYANLWEEIIRSPMFYSAVTRQRIATLKQQVTGWEQTLRSVASNPKNVAAYRTRALDIMQWFGPAPAVEWLDELASTESVPVRCKVASILGARSEPLAQETLRRLLADPEPQVQRITCEALLRSTDTVDPLLLQPLLQSDDHAVTTAARRLLEAQPSETWEAWITSTESDALFVQAALATMTSQPTLQRAYECLVGVDKRMSNAETAEAKLNLLRVTQLALGRGQVDPELIPAFVRKMSAWFPADDARVNRELTSVLAYLKATHIQDRYLKYLHDETIPTVDRLHFAMHIQLIGDRLALETRLQLLAFLEEAKFWPGGGSYQHYVMQACRDLAKTLPADQAITILERGGDWPNGALMMLSHLPKPLDTDTLGTIRQLETQLTDRQDPSSRELKIGLVAVLGETLSQSAGGETQSQIVETLIEIWKNDPNRRVFAVMAMAQASPATANAELPAATSEDSAPAEMFWTYFLRSLPVLNAYAADEVFQSFLKMDKTSQHPEHLRQLMLIGLRYPSVSSRVIEVLEKWTQLPPENRPGSLAAWQSWYAARFPHELPASLPAANESSKWSMEEIQKQLQILTGDRQRGQLAYQQANCANCHVYQGQGQGGIGPDLNGLVQRFSQREIIESIIHPSVVISDRYRSEIIQLEDGRVLSGIVTPLAGGQVAVVDSAADRTEISKIDIVEIRKSPQSIMPSGLLDGLDAQQVVDLMTYLLEEKRERVAAQE